MNTPKSRTSKSEFEADRDRLVRRLNDISILRQLTAFGLESVKERVEQKPSPEMYFFTVTASGKRKQISRKVARLRELIHTAISRDLVSQSLIIGVALTEDYLGSVLRQVLLRWPQKLQINASGQTSEKSISLEDVLSTSSRDELLSRIIDNKLMALLYKSPADCFRYIEKALSIVVEDAVKDRYAEVKATRDLVVHNNGVVNDVYLRKAASKARAQDGELIPLDAEYFSQAIQCMKRLANTVCKQAEKKYLKAAAATGSHRP